MSRATTFRLPAFSAVPPNEPPQLANQSNNLTICNPAQFFRHRIFCFPAEPWGAIVPGSNQLTRPKIFRGVRRPASSPGGIASQDCRFVVRLDDGACLPLVV